MTALTSLAHAQTTPRLRSPFETTFDAAWLRELPWSSDVTALLETVEAAAVSDRFAGIGLQTGSPARLGIHAASWTELQYRVAGFDLTDAAQGGTPLVLLPRIAVDGLRFDTAALGPESGGAGAILSLDIAKPAAEREGRASVGFAPSAFQTNVPSGTPPAIARTRAAHELSALAQGPISGGFRGGLALEWERGESSERASSLKLRGDRWSALGQLVFAPNDTDEARLLLAAHDIDRPFVGRARFVLPTVTERDRAFFAGASWQRAAASGRRLGASLSFAERNSDPPSEVGAGVSLDRLWSGPIAETVADPSRLRVVRGEASFTARPRITGRLRHEASLFAQGESSSLHTTASPTSTLPVSVAELIDGRPARVWTFSETGTATRSLSRLGLGARYRASLQERVSARLGLRYDSQSGSRADASNLISWSDLAPHATIELRPLARLPLTLHGGYARYAGRLPLALLAYSDPAARSANVYRWSDPNRDAVYQTGERGVLIARTGPGGSVAEVDPNLVGPRTTEWSVGLGVERGRLRFTFAGLHRRTERVVETQNVGVPASSYRLRAASDPGVDLVGEADDQLLPFYERAPSSFGQDHYLLTNPSDHDVVHEGVELALELLPREHFRMRVSGTASKTVGAGANRGFLSSENDPGVPGELYDNPNADSFKAGRMFFDRAYTAKFGASYRARGFTLGSIIRYQDGQPFARMVIAEGLAQGPELVAAVARGDHRFTYVLSVDARLSREFAVGRTRASVGLDALSLFRQRREVEEYVISGDRFREVSAVQPPRALRLTASVAF